MKFSVLPAMLVVVFAVIPSPAPAQNDASLDRVAVPAGVDNTTVRSYVLAARARGDRVDGATASRIFGGRPAEPGAWPAQVSLHATDKLDGTAEGRFSSSFCGGSLIARQWVLTAAHCVVDEEARPVPADSVAVRSGSNDLDKGDVRKVARVIVHEDYNPLLIDNDIALLQLVEPIRDSSGPVGAIPVHTPKTPLSEGPAVIIGWGMMEEEKFPVNLMETDIDIMANDTCNRGMAEQSKREFGRILMMLGATNRIPQSKLEEAYTILVNNLGDALSENMICAGIPSGKRTSCSGDSGGPLMVRQQDGEWLQVGIVSWGREPLDATGRCAHEGLYSVYTRVANYFDWIASHVRN